MPTVAIASEFLDAFARIPKAQQRKVRAFTEKFRAEPTSRAINYEKLHHACDDKVRSVRIDRDYRAIILHPEHGDVYMLVWVDSHDNAMDWAKNRRFDINPATGALQVVNTTVVEEFAPAQRPAAKKEKKAPALLEEFDDAVLLPFGVPEILLPAVRSVKTEKDLYDLCKHLPAEAAEALVWMVDGVPVDEIREAMVGREKPAAVDTKDFKAALEHPDSKRRFVEVQTEQDLASILNAPLEKWRVFLHPSQERVVTRNFKGPAKVTGGAGTGKTVCAMHRARHLACKVFAEKTDRILLTTFTANLAQNIQQNLKALCGDEIDRIEAVHIHSWAVRFMRTQNVSFGIANDTDMKACWDEALALSDEPEFSAGFLKQEWARVIQANGIGTKEEYFRFSRIGRGKTLTRAQRAKLWKITEEYREALKERGLFEWIDVIRETRKFLEKHPGLLPYRAVVVDEGQDMDPEEWRLIRAIVPKGANDIFLVGDAHQRIYGRKVVLSRCGIDVRGRSSRLRINYRTTEQIRDWAVNLLEGVEVDDLDNAGDSRTGYRSLLTGADPEVLAFDTLEKEQKALVSRIRQLLKERKPEEICLVARTSKPIRDDYQPALEAAGIPTTILDKTETPPEGTVRLATMHRVKGLEFPVVVIVGANHNIIPLRAALGNDDEVYRQEQEERERALLFVSATRARDTLVVTCHGKPSSLLAELNEKTRTNGTLDLQPKKKTGE